MQLNGSALNGAAINASARSTFILAFCAAVASASVSAQADVARYATAVAAGGCAIAASPWQQHATAGALTCTADVLAAPPYQTFATAAIAVASGHGSANGLVTRYCLAGISASGESSAAGSVTHSATAGMSASGSATATGFAILPAVANVTGSAGMQSNPPVTRRGLAAVQGVCMAMANGVHAARGSAACKGTATITAHAGYGMPSATALLSSAQVYAYAKATRMATATAAGSANVTAKGKLHAYGAANISCGAQAGAWVIQTQGAADATGPSAEVIADATYQHMAHGAGGAFAEVVADTFAIRYVDAAMGGSATLRVETQVNNELEGFALPDALSTVTLNALGVVVAPLISHFDGSAEISASGTYQHMAHAAGGAFAEAEAIAIYEHGALADISCESSVAADAHFEWYGSAAISGSAFDVEAYPALRQLAEAKASAHADAVAAGVLITRGTVAAESSAVATADALIDRRGFAAVDVSANLFALASTVGNPSARDPAERSMSRPFTDRTMRRPFVDRTMKATRT